MDSHSEQRFRQRVFVLSGLIFAHLGFFGLVFWLSGLYDGLLSGESRLAWFLVILSVLGGYYLVKTYRSRQRALSNRQFQIDHRFAGDKQYCETCDVITPLRTKHCKTCETCVERFDHHCILLGVCIGRHNHASFWTTLLIDTVILFNLWFILARTWWLHGGYFYIFLLFVALPPSLCIFGLLVFHTWMALSNQTTWEWASHDKIYYLQDLEEEILPFDLGCIKNCREFFFRMHQRDYVWNVSSEIYQEGYEPPSNCCNNKYYSCF